MSREKLVDIANRFTAWISSHDLDPSTPSSFVSPNVVLHVPFPGLSPDFAGLLGQHERTIKATNDMKVVVKETSVDETNCMVTQFFEVTGTQTGYSRPPPPSHTCFESGPLERGRQALTLRFHSEWIGIPATGKPYKITGIGMIKVRLILVRKLNSAG